MVAASIARHRLYNQRIAGEKSERPSQALAWLGALQAQDLASVKWAVGLRCRGATDATIDQAIVDRTIVRTWLMRGTLQVVAAADVRWMLALLAPRIIASSARRYRQLDLDEPTFARSYETLVRALQGGQPLTRAEILSALEQAGISIDGQRGYHILRRAGLEGLVCFGPMRAGEETFVLLDEWVFHSKSIEHDAALSELARRYFTSRGPATLRDFVWWSGLLVADARAGLETAKAQLDQATIDEQTYWLPQNDTVLQDPSPTAYLLPAFDEYYLGYQLRDAVLDAEYDPRAVSSYGVFRPMIVIDGQIVGTWKRTLKKDSLVVTLNPFDPLKAAENQALAATANQYGAFLGRSVVLA